MTECQRVTEYKRKALQANIDNGIVAAILAGKPIERMSLIFRDVWVDADGGALCNPIITHRVKPEPKVCDTPLAFIDIHPGMVFHECSWHVWMHPIVCSSSGLVFYAADKSCIEVTFARLMDRYEFSFDTERWYPCTKEGLAKYRVWFSSLPK